MVNIINDYGKISITSEVFTYLAGDAATSCFGVKGMAGRSKEGGPLQLLRRESMSKGVEVKFVDRVRALEALCGLLGGDTGRGAEELLQALSAAGEEEGAWEHG